MGSPDCFIGVGFSLGVEEKSPASKPTSKKTCSARLNHNALAKGDFVVK
jgi:hypothetical protein